MSNTYQQGYVDGASSAPSVTPQERATLTHLLGHLKRVAQRRQGDAVGHRAAQRYDALSRVLALDQTYESAVGAVIIQPPGTPAGVHDIRVDGVSCPVEGSATAKPAQAPISPDPNQELKGAGYDVNAFGGDDYVGWEMRRRGRHISDSHSEAGAWAAARQHFNEAQAKAIEDDRLPAGYSVGAEEGKWHLRTPEGGHAFFLTRANALACAKVLSGMVSLPDLIDQAEGISRARAIKAMRF